MNDRILVIRTGGTIDAEPYADPRQPPQSVDTLKEKDSLVFPTIAALPHGEKIDGLNWGRWVHLVVTRRASRHEAGAPQRESDYTQTAVHG